MSPATPPITGSRGGAPRTSLTWRRYRWGYMGAAFAGVGLVLAIGSAYSRDKMLAEYPELRPLVRQDSVQDLLRQTPPSTRPPGGASLEPGSPDYGGSQNDLNGADSPVSSFASSPACPTRPSHTWTPEEKASCSAHHTRRVLLKNHGRYEVVGWITAALGAVAALFGFLFPAKGYDDDGSSPAPGVSPSSESVDPRA